MYDFSFYQACMGQTQLVYGCTWGKMVLQTMGNQINKERLVLREVEMKENQRDWY